MVQPINTAAIESGTARNWREWLAFLDSIGAETLTHKEIAWRVHETGDASGWWAQSIAVAYEQHIGRRAPGQDGDGKFAVSVTRTVAGDMDRAFERWLALMEAGPTSPGWPSRAGRKPAAARNGATGAVASGMEHASRSASNKRRRARLASASATRSSNRMRGSSTGAPSGRVCSRRFDRDLRRPTRCSARLTRSAICGGKISI